MAAVVLELKWDRAAEDIVAAGAAEPARRRVDPKEFASRCQLVAASIFEAAPSPCQAAVGVASMVQSPDVALRPLPLADLVPSCA
jgi:hypothetical protein